MDTEVFSDLNDLIDELLLVNSDGGLQTQTPKLQHSPTLPLPLVTLQIPLSQNPQVAVPGL